VSAWDHYDQMKTINNIPLAVMARLRQPRPQLELITVNTKRSFTTTTHQSK
jgi:hypothetical protein